MRNIAFEQMENLKYGIQVEEDYPLEINVPLKHGRGKIGIKDKKEFLTKIQRKRDRLEFWKTVLKDNPDDIKAAQEVAALQGYIEKRKRGIQEKKDSHRLGKKNALGERSYIPGTGKKVVRALRTDPIVFAE